MRAVFWEFVVAVDPNTDLSMALKGERSWGEIDQRQTEEVPISGALGPNFDLLVRF